MPRKKRQQDKASARLSMNPRFIALIEASRASLREEGGISDEEMRRRLGLAD